MVVRTRKKVTKYRAHTTHGGGHRKKRRGAGSRGGRGNAGSGKRAGQKKAGQHRVFGKKGFLPRRMSSGQNAVNLHYFTLKRVEALVIAGNAAKEGDMFVIDCAKLGFTKLLGTGMPECKVSLTIAAASSRALEKISLAGGKVTVSGSEEAAPARKDESA